MCHCTFFRQYTQRDEHEKYQQASWRWSYSQERYQPSSTITSYGHLRTLTDTYGHLKNIADAAIIHFGINDILRSKDSNDLNDLPENVIKVGKICQNHNIGKIFISGITPSTRANVDISNINKKIGELCKKNNFEFIEHPQITTDYPWHDGIHLQDTGKSLLGQNFINRVSRFLCKNDFFWRVLASRRPFDSIRNFN